MTDGNGLGRGPDTDPSYPLEIGACFDGTRVGEPLDSCCFGCDPADRVGSALFDSERMKIEVGGCSQSLGVGRKPQRHRARRR